MASTQIETVSTGLNKAKMILVGVFVAAALVAFYFFTGRGALLQWGSLLGGLALAALLFFTAESGQRLVAFSRDAWRETQKVVWPSRREALQTAAFVFAFSVAMAVVLWLADQFLQWALYDMILGWR
ncbi:MAG: preprotein translocase subunit SecE [Ottowia sp.]|nr:preprotein translocase subunit SecE [Ottowia sp.]